MVSTGDVETEKTGLDGRFFYARDLVDFASSAIPPFSLIDSQVPQGDSVYPKTC